MKQKKEAIIKYAKEFLDAHGEVSDNGTKIGYLNKSRGVYTGVVYKPAHTNIYHKPVKEAYYGFYLDFANSKIMLESSSGNQLQANPINLSKVFPSANQMKQFKSRTSEMLYRFGFMLGALGQEEYNIGRGLYRAVMNPYAETFYKDFMIDNEGNLKEGQLIPNWVGDISSYSVHRSSGMTWGDLLLITSQYALEPQRNVYQRPINRILFDIPRSSKEGFGTMVTLHNELLNNNRKGNLRKDLGIGKKMYNYMRNLQVEDLLRFYCNDTSYSPIYDLHGWEYIVWRYPVKQRLMQAVDKLYDKNDTILVTKDDFIYGINHSLSQINNITKMMAEVGKQVELYKLLEYIGVDVYTHQATGSIEEIIRLLEDYYQMVYKYPNFIKYPKYLVVAHDIASRNYKGHKDEAQTHNIYNTYKEEYKNYEGLFLYNSEKFPVVALRSAEEIIAEGTAQSNCVGSYSQRVADGKSYIFSLRQPKDYSKSWITIEVKNGEVVQAFQTYNQRVTGRALEFLQAWANRVGYKANKFLGLEEGENNPANIKARLLSDSIEENHLTSLEKLEGVKLTDDVSQYIGRL